MITKLIDEKLQKEQKEKEGRLRSHCFSPSLFGRCYRLQYWNRKNIPQSNPPDNISLRKFAVGKIFHEWIQKLLPEHQNEVLCKEDDVCGYADIVTADTVYDIKSSHSRAFWYMEKSNYDVNKEKETNIIQVCYYALRLNKPKATLIFVSKDDLYTAEYGFNPLNWKEKIEAELTVLRDYWSKNITPPAGPRAYAGKDCEYCSFQTYCKTQPKGALNE